LVPQSFDIAFLALGLTFREGEVLEGGFELGADSFDGLFLCGGGGMFSCEGRGCCAVGFGEFFVFSGTRVR